MNFPRNFSVFIVLFAWMGGVAAQAQETKTSIPYRITDSQHILVRAKVNGKGPFNLIVDTGCPVLLLNPGSAKKAGLVPDAKLKANIETFEFEGGLEMKNVSCLVTTPFQIDGMNSLGLAGVELHGLLGYTVLAKLRIEYDFTKAKLSAIPLAFEPPAPKTMAQGKGQVGTGGMEIMVGVMKTLAPLLGLTPPPPPVPRGFLGFDVEEKGQDLVVHRIVPQAPAELGGLKVGDVLTHVNDKGVKKRSDLASLLNAVRVEQTIRFRILRAGETKDLTATADKGL